MTHRLAAGRGRQIGSGKCRAFDRDFDPPAHHRDYCRGRRRLCGELALSSLVKGGVVRSHGFLGDRVVINGGAFVLPFIHDFTPVNMNVLPMQIVRQKGDAVITRDRMRIGIEADFYVSVEATREAVSIVAATLGRRISSPSGFTPCCPASSFPLCVRSLPK
jgi:hypothetical protein